MCNCKRITLDHILGMSQLLPQIRLWDRIYCLTTVQCAVSHLTASDCGCEIE